MADELGWTGTLTFAFQVRDRKAAARWYQEMLGFGLLYDAEEIGWCEVSTPVPGVTIGLSEGEAPGEGGPVATFTVADLDGARARLEAGGVVFDGFTVVIEGTAKLAVFSDLDGHALALAQDLQGAGKGGGR